jgi:hypothetical protein
MLPHAPLERRPRIDQGQREGLAMARSTRQLRSSWPRWALPPLRPAPRRASSERPARSRASAGRRTPAGRHLRSSLRRPLGRADFASTREDGLGLPSPRGGSVLQGQLPATGSVFHRQASILRRWESLAARETETSEGVASPIAGLPRPDGQERRSSASRSGGSGIQPA